MAYWLEQTKETKLTESPMFRNETAGILPTSESSDFKHIRLNQKNGRFRIQPYSNAFVHT